MMLVMQVHLETCDVRNPTATIGNKITKQHGFTISTYMTQLENTTDMFLRGT
jgi:hypothetical protein